MAEAKRCDWRCHTAATERCTCWCGGNYHGIGSAEAARRMCADFGLDPERFRHRGFRGVSDPSDSGDLFSPELRVRTRGLALLAAAARFIRERLS